MKVCIALLLFAAACSKPPAYPCPGAQADPSWTALGIPLPGGKVCAALGAEDVDLLHEGSPFASLRTAYREHFAHLGYQPVGRPEEAPGQWAATLEGPKGDKIRIVIQDLPGWKNKPVEVKLAKTTP